MRTRETEVPTIERDNRKDNNEEGDNIKLEQTGKRDKIEHKGRDNRDTWSTILHETIEKDNRKEVSVVDNKTVESKKRRRSGEETISTVEKRKKNKDERAKAEHNGKEGENDNDNRTRMKTDNRIEEKAKTIEVNSRKDRKIRAGESSAKFKIKSEENPPKTIRKSKKQILLDEGKLQSNKIQNYFKEKTPSEGKGKEISKSTLIFNMDNLKDNVDKASSHLENAQRLTPNFESRTKRVPEQRKDWRGTERSTEEIKQEQKSSKVPAVEKGLTITRNTECPAKWSDEK